MRNRRNPLERPWVWSEPCRGGCRQPRVDPKLSYVGSLGRHLLVWSSSWSVRVNPIDWLRSITHMQSAREVVEMVAPYIA
jgi:hypothetical protein